MACHVYMRNEVFEAPSQRVVEAILGSGVDTYKSDILFETWALFWQRYSADVTLAVDWRLRTQN